VIAVMLNHHSTFVIIHSYIIPTLAVMLRISADGLNHPYTPMQSEKNKFI
jgi:hypothetical protein